LSNSRKDSVIGTVLAIWIIAEKLINIAQGIKFRNATDNPLFYFGLVAIILGVQLFLAGFIGEMLVRHGQHKAADSVIAERVGYGQASRISNPV